MINTRLFDFISKCPSPFHTVKTVSEVLEGEGFRKLSENEEWSLFGGGKFYVTRNDSALIAFTVPEYAFEGFMITASHSDSPSFALRGEPEYSENGYIKISCEKYGGMIYSSWLDRPLSIAGRVTYRDGNAVKSKLIDFETPCAIIPNIPIHLDRKFNDNSSLNPAVDLKPIYAAENDSISLKNDICIVAGINEEDYLSSDLNLYVCEKGYEFNNLIYAPRLDDLQCVFSSLCAFTGSDNQNASNVLCVFDNEEVGSRTRQGAASTFLLDTLKNICICCDGKDTLSSRLVSSMLLSCDNAHAIHPNHPELYDKNSVPVLNGGIVIKRSASRSYTTDSLSEGIFRLICERAGVKTQTYNNRADIPGGGTLAAISLSNVGILSCDIGIAQLAMHSALESAGGEDTEAAADALRAFYSVGLSPRSDGSFEVISD